ncbi:MAG: type II toxin-antitoxin system RelE/ParE family toxin [Pseudomonadota bacterium]|uniref:type II toxin-antitoxin system RelE/ParE family toxin n=1 Tax=Sphingobium sp. TaxID=1912891 RepID=UPI002E2297CF
MTVAFTPAAHRDLADVWFYTFDHWSAAQADAYVGAIHSALAMAAENPSMGHPIDEARTGYWRTRPVATFATSNAKETRSPSCASCTSAWTR